MKKIVMGIFLLLMMGSVFAQSVAQDDSHTIVIKNNSSDMISVQDAGGNCMGGTVLSPTISPNQTAGAIQVDAKFCAAGTQHHQFEIFDQNNNSLGYISVSRSNERFSTGVSSAPSGTTPSAKVSLNQTGDEWVFNVTNK